MIVLSRGWEALGFCFRKYLFVSSILFWDCFKVFILVGFDSPFLGKVGTIDDYLIPFFPFVGPCQLTVHFFGRLDKIGCQSVASDPFYWSDV